MKEPTATDRAKRLRKMTFAARSRCPCGAGLAYDDTCVQGPFAGPSYWDCSAILLGDAIPSGRPGSVQHTDRLPFAFWEIKSEGQPSAHGETTRPKEPAPMNAPTPRKRTIRTALQAAVAVCVAVPTAIALIPDGGGWRAIAIGITGAFVVLVSAGQNALDRRAGRG